MKENEEREFLYRKEEQVEWFNKIGVDEFAIWIKDFLTHGWRDIFVLNVGESDRDIFLKEYFYSVDDARFRENFRKAILRLLLQWNCSYDDISLLYKLFNMIGWTRNIDCFDKLLDMALNEEIKHISYRKTINMHERLLAVLFSLKIKNDGIISLIERDIKDHRFAQLCFRKSWETTGNIMDSIKYLPDLFECGKEFPLTHLTFSRFIRKIGAPNFVNNFESICKELKRLEYRISLLNYLSVIGVEWFLIEKFLVFRFPWDKQREWSIELRDPDLIFGFADQEGTIPVDTLEKRMSSLLSSPEVTNT
jgi:hypothetical protein